MALAVAGTQRAAAIAGSTAVAAVAVARARTAAAPAPAVLPRPRARAGRRAAPRSGRRAALWPLGMAAIASTAAPGGESERLTESSS
eukprot:CAMPEP_0115417128 /NCGR_PEP_ID=MMETSP0271-20121206/23967_1 /TAXON_ID=71861 /ORGANISM="Scrippsiella trochoidea, Strain CCMP3099" /LENGTH=86 /DNA_ID=CAMNT_0002841511 /DNA_START=374 /DNA_END=634 /DNA_ORIENTATION=-